MATVKRFSLLAVPMLAALAVGWVLTSPSVSACGGFFCTTTPVDQNAERIIFTQNGDGTVSAYVQIEYTGEAPDFSWILPLPEAIDAEAVEVPEDAMAAFTELEVATDPVFLMPPWPECLQDRAAAAMSSTAASSSVEVFATGEVGPYGFDVVGSEDPDALISWLRDNNYRVTEEMEPLIDLYVVEGFVFLAMRLRPDAGVQDVEPVKVTYPSERSAKLPRVESEARDRPLRAEAAGRDYAGVVRCHEAEHGRLVQARGNQLDPAGRKPLACVQQVVAILLGKRCCACRTSGL